MAFKKAASVETLTRRASGWDSPDVETWTTGNPFIDWMTGVGGLPKGRMIECYGPEGVGKSTLAFQAAAAAWEAYGVPSYLADFEQTGSAKYFEALGLTREGLDWETPDTLEQFFGDVNKILKKGPKYAYIILDSVAAARTEYDFSGDPNATKVADLAKVMNQGLKVLVPLLTATNTTLFLVNQTRDVIDTSGSFMTPAMRAMAPTDRTPGGKAIKFYASLRIRFTPSTSIKAQKVDPLSGELQKVEVGRWVTIKLDKSKVSAPPHRKLRIQIRDGHGFDFVQNLIDAAQTHGFLNRGVGAKWSITGGIADEYGPIKGDDLMYGTVVSDDVLREALTAATMARVMELEALDTIDEDANEEPASTGWQDL